MEKSKNIQMPIEFLNHVAKLIDNLEREEISEDSRNICKHIESIMIEKLERIEKREAFTAYKKAPNEEKETKLSEYIKRAEKS